jgi:hypothetical protein
MVKIADKMISLELVRSKSHYNSLATPKTVLTMSPPKTLVFPKENSH